MQARRGHTQDSAHSPIFARVRSTNRTDRRQSPELVEGVEPDFIEASRRGGGFKGKDRSIKASGCAEKWVYSAPVLTSVRPRMEGRLRDFCRFGAGAAIGHWTLPLAGRREGRLAGLLEDSRRQRDRPEAEAALLRSSANLTAGACVRQPPPLGPDGKRSRGWLLAEPLLPGVTRCHIRRVGHLPLGPTGGLSSSVSDAVAVSPKDGSVVLVWTDAAHTLKVARSADRGTSWAVRDVTPFAGTVGLPWIDVAPDGTIGVTFVADADAIPGEDFSIYGMLIDPARFSRSPANGCPPGVTALGPVPRTQTEDGLFQRDFFQLAFTPDNDLHLVFTGGRTYDKRTVAYTQAKRARL